MRYLAMVFLVAVACGGAVSLGQSLAIPPGILMPVWPLSGIALAALLLGGDRLWPGIWLGSLLALSGTRLDPDRSFSVAASLPAGAAIATGLTVQTLVGRRLIDGLAGGGSFPNHPRGVLGFTVGAMLMCLIGSTLWAASLSMGGIRPRSESVLVWTTSWLGDLAGTLVFTPLVLAWLRPLEARRDPGRLAEVAAFAGLLSAATWPVFGGWLPAGTAMNYLAFPVLIWAAFRLGRRGATASIGLVAAMAAWGTARGHGPFQGETLSLSLLPLQIYICVLAPSILATAAAIEERRRAVGAMGELNRTLERQAAERAALAARRAGHLARAEEDCRKQARTLRSVLENILEGVVVADARGEILLWNPAAERLLGLPGADPAQASSRFGCFLPDQVTPCPVDRLPLTRVLRGEVIGGEDLFFRNAARPDGLWLRITGVPLRREDEEAGGGVVVCRDVTDLRQAERRLESIVESILIGIIAMDHRGRITLVNSQVERLFGYTRDELCGQPIEVLVPESLRDAHRRHVEGYLRDPRARPMAAPRDIEARRKDGSVFPVEISIHSYTFDGEVFAVATVRDLTEHHRLTEALETNLLVQGAIGQILRSSLEPIGLDEQLGRALDLILSVPWFSPPARGGIALAEGDDHTLVPKARRGLPPGDRDGASPGRCICGHALRHREVVFTGGPEAARGSRLPGHRLSAHYCVPILDGEHYGVIRVFVDGHRPRRPEEEEFLASVASILAGTIERRRAEEAMRGSEARLRTLIDSIPQLAWTARPDGYIFWFNKRWYEYTGTVPGQVEGWGWQSLHDPQVLPGVLQRWRASVITGEPFDMVFPLRGGDGRFRSFLTRVVPIRDERGGVVQWFGTNTDITERAEAEAALRASAARLRQLADTMPQIVWTASSDGTIIYLNERWYQYTGLTPEVSLVLDGLMVATHPEDRDRFARYRAHALGAGEGYESEVRLLHRSGAYRWHLIRSVPVLDEAGRVARRFGTATDIDDLRRTEEALRASERQYRAVYDQAAVGIAEVDLTGRFLRANDRYCEIVGYPHEELLRLRFQDITHPDDPPAHREHFARLAEVDGPSSYTIEKRYVRKDGRVVWARTAVSLIRDAVGGPERIVAVAEDITERKLAEEELRQSEARFRAISEAAPLGIFLADAAGDCLYTNPAYFELTGRTTDEFLGKGWKEVIHPEDRERVLAEWDQAARNRLPFERTYRLLHRDGRTIWVSTKSAEIRVGEALLGYVGVAEDITQKRAALESLRRSEERFDLAVRGTDAGIWDWDLRTGAIYFSTRWKSMLGYDEGEIGDKLIEWESRIHPDDRGRAGEAVHAYLEGQSAEYEVEHRLRHKDGSYRWILARGAAVRDDDGRPYRMVGSHIDVTVYRRTAEQLNENLVQLRAAHKIQQALLPSQSPALAGLELAGFSIPAAYAGGDMFDYPPMLGGTLGIVVGDVSGHGIAAALQMASTRAFVRSLAQTCSTVGEVMTRVNRFVFDETQGDSFVTMMLIRLDPGTRTLTYANAGHPTGYVLDPSGAVRAELRSSALPLGVDEQYDFAGAEPVTLQPGELLVLVTDGILEARSPAGHFFGAERLLDVVRATRERAGHEILEEVHRAVGRHTTTPVFEDDVTAVVIKVARQGPYSGGVPG